MNIYKIYFGHLINAINSFKNDFSYTFDIETYLTKLTLEPPKETINGDMSTNMAMVLSKEIKLNPRQIAQNFVPYIAKISGIEKVDVAGAGFINIKLAQVTWTSCLKNILLNELDWDKFDLGKGKNINLEFVSGFGPPSFTAITISFPILVNVLAIADQRFIFRAFLNSNALPIFF